MHFISIKEAAKETGHRPAELRRLAERQHCFRMVGKTGYTFVEALPWLKKGGDQLGAYPLWRLDHDYVAINERLNAVLKKTKGPWVYFLRADDFVKIGVGKNVQKRRTALSIGCPSAIHLIGLINPELYPEWTVHERFASLRHRGEWFRMDDAIWAFLREYGTI